MTTRLTPMSLYYWPPKSRQWDSSNEYLYFKVNKEKIKLTHSWAGYFADKLWKAWTGHTHHSSGLALIWGADQPLHLVQSNCPSYSFTCRPVLLMVFPDTSDFYIFLEVLESISQQTSRLLLFSTYHVFELALWKRRLRQQFRSSSFPAKIK